MCEAVKQGGERFGVRKKTGGIDAAGSGDFASGAHSPKVASHDRWMAREIARMYFVESVGMVFCRCFLFFNDGKRF